MSLPDVLAFLDFTDELGIVPWLAGSWAAEAADGAQAGRHDDLDLFVDAQHAATLTQHLALRGFAVERLEPWRVLYTDRHGRALDVRLFERNGNEITYGPDERWPVTVLDGYGLLGDRAVRRLALA